MLCCVRRFSQIVRGDLAIVGGGPGGYTAAIKAAQHGLKVVCVEKTEHLGGTCLNVGCIPSKSLLHSSHLFEQAKNRFPTHGIRVSNLLLDLQQVMNKKNDTVSILRKGIDYLFKRHKIERIVGTGTLLDPQRIKVTTRNNENITVEAKNIILATGSEPIDVPGIHVNEVDIVSSTGALSLGSVPKKLLVIGGGVIGLELGSVWNSFGASVTVIDLQPSIGVEMDGHVASTFMGILKRSGVKFILSSAVTSLERKNSGYIANITSKNGKKIKLETDIVLVAIGRRPVTRNIGLETVGINKDKSGKVVVNEKFQTNIPSIFAIGDIIHGPMLAHKAEEDGIATVMGILGKGFIMDYNTIPFVVYTHPEVAWVGKSEEKLKNEGTKYVSGIFPMSINGRALTIGETDGFVKILANSKTGNILGCHIIGQNAGELISEISLAIKNNLKTSDIIHTIHPHPTISEAVREACMAAGIHGEKAIHMP